jgi:hypothetical protein
MLAIARDRADALGVALDKRAGDNRALELHLPAELLTSPVSKRQHLPTWHDRRRVFERVAASLRPGGRFAWNAFVFSPWVATDYHGMWRDENGVRIRVDHVPADNRLTVALESGESTTLWWVTRSEWEGLIDVSGLEVEALYGWFDRRPFDEESAEMVWVVRKPA